MRFYIIRPPFWDVPLIQWKLDNLCKNKAGTHVYEEVVLGPVHWNENGRLIFHIPQDHAPLGFEEISKTDYNFSPTLGIIRYRKLMMRTIDKKIVRDRIRFFSHQGWIHRMVFPKGGKQICPDINENTYEKFYLAIFKQQSK